MFYFYGIIIASILYGLEIRECFYNAICLGVTFPIYLIFFVLECCIILVGITRWPSNFDPVSVLWVFPWWYGVTPAQCILCTYWIIIVRVQVFFALGVAFKTFQGYIVRYGFSCNITSCWNISYDDLYSKIFTKG